MAERGEIEEENAAMPVGKRIAIIFLSLVTTVMILPFAGLVLGAFGTLISAAWADDPFPEGIAISLLLFGAVSIFAPVLLSSLWMILNLERRSAASPPRHPARIIFLPSVWLLVAGGVVAVTVWIPSVFHNDASRTFPWPLIWGSVGSGSFVLYRYLNRILPK